VATIYVDGKAYDVDPNQNLLDACLSLGLNIPYFCWHPAMGSIGACRQCAVKQYKDENDTQGTIVMSCMTQAADGTRISIDDPEVVEFRASVIEWLMMNHPHDCPICDEGGECHLQDMTVMTGHSYRRYRFNKRTYRNQYLGPFINHEMNRCIQCYRCVRFYREYAGGRDFDVLGAHDALYYGRHEDGVLESEFSGNLVEVCPTGVFTDKTLKRHYTRKWDLQTAPSICTHCSLGCNITPGERYGALRRVRNRYNWEVNGYFICDRGRYGYEFVNSEARLREPAVRDGDGEPRGAAGAEAVARIADAIQSGQPVIGIGSPRASLESNHTLRKLVGEEQFFMGQPEAELDLVSAAVQILRGGPVPTASMRQVRKSDAALVLGEDLTNTAPMLALAVRQTARQAPMSISRGLGIPDWNDAAVREALQSERGPIYLATVAATKLEDVARETYHAAPQDLARLGYAVAHAIDPAAPSVDDLSPELEARAEAIAADLLAAESPVVISGVSSGERAIIEAAANVARALHARNTSTRLAFVLTAPNDFGVALFGAGGLESARRALEGAEKPLLVVLENDLFGRDAALAEAVLDAAGTLAVLDGLESQTSGGADIILPSGTFAESDGTFVNNEGRAQRFFQVFVPEGEIQESWRWLNAVRAAVDGEDAAAKMNLDEVTRAMIDDMPVLAPIADIAPGADFRVAGERIPRQPHRYSGRTAMHADVDVNERRPPEDADSALAFSMEGYRGIPPAALLPRVWAPGWNSVQALNKFQSEVAGPLIGGDPGVRLIEANEEADFPYSDTIPQAFEPREGEKLLVPLHHIFGSEPLSALSPGVQELSPEPYFGMNPEDAGVLGLEEGAALRLTVSGQSAAFPLRYIASLPRGVIGFPFGLPQTAGQLSAGWAAQETDQGE
jgi:NADH-quinone oxidoreductase subunit G